MLRLLFALLRRDALLLLRMGGGYMAYMSFFMLVCTVFVFGIGPSPALFGQMLPSILWSSLLLTSLLHMRIIFADDYDDGSLEQLYLLGRSLWQLVVVKMMVHWLLSVLPIIVMAWLILWVNDYVDLSMFMVALLLGSVVLTAIVAFVGALTLGARYVSFIAGVIYFPLAVPLVIFGVQASQDSYHEAAVTMLVGMVLFIVPLSVVFTSQAIRYAIQDDG